MTAIYKGQCFCGAVQLEVSGTPEVMSYCHCESCRSWSGSPVHASTLWKSEAVRVVAGESTMAKTVELHEMAMDGSMMRMRQVKEIAVPPKSRVELKPGGLHVMLFGLKQPLKAGDLVPLTLTLADGNTLSFEATVRPPDSSK